MNRLSRFAVTSERTSYYNASLFQEKFNLSKYVMLCKRLESCQLSLLVIIHYFDRFRLFSELNVETKFIFDAKSIEMFLKIRTVKGKECFVLTSIVGCEGI